MSFQEKSAWIMALALTVISIMCGWSVYEASVAAGGLVSPSIGLISSYTLVLVVIVVAGQIVISICSPKQASTPADEREIHIERKAGYTSGWIMGEGPLACGPSRGSPCPRAPNPPEGWVAPRGGRRRWPPPPGTGRTTSGHGRSPAPPGCGSTRGRRRR